MKMNYFVLGKGRKRGENNVVLTLLELTLKCTGTWREEILKRVWLWSSWNSGPGSSAFQSITRTLQSSAALCSSTICMYFHRNHQVVKQAGQIFLLISAGTKMPAVLCRARAFSLTQTFTVVLSSSWAAWALQKGWECFTAVTPKQLHGSPWVHMKLSRVNLQKPVVRDSRNCESLSDVSDPVSKRAQEILRRNPVRSVVRLLCPPMWEHAEENEIISSLRKNLTVFLKEFDWQV